MAKYRRVHAGDLNRPVTWKAYDPQGARAADGQPIPAYLDRGEHWASIEPLKGAALINATAIIPARWVEVVMHPIGPIRALDQIHYDGRIFTVQNINDDFEQGAYLSIQATETPANPGS